MIRHNSWVSKFFKTTVTKLRVMVTLKIVQPMTTSFFQTSQSYSIEWDFYTITISIYGGIERYLITAYTSAIETNYRLQNRTNLNPRAGRQAGGRQWSAMLCPKESRPINKTEDIVNFISYFARVFAATPLLQPARLTLSF